MYVRVAVSILVLIVWIIVCIICDLQILIWILLLNIRRQNLGVSRISNL